MDLRAHTVLLCVAGSRAQGLAGPDSDVDLRGAAVPPAAVLHGFRQAFAQADQPGDMDVFVDTLTDEEQAVVARTKVEGSIYSLAKFARLCVDCNPNLLETLFARDAEVRVCTPLGERLREHRQAFLSHKAQHTFTGYALGQLKRIRGHRQWLLSPPAAPPTREAFGLPRRTLVPKDHLAAAQAAVRKRLDEWNPDWGPLPHSEITRLQTQLEGFLEEVLLAGESPWHRAARSIGLDDDLIEAMDRERRYKNAQRNWEQYRTWQRQRNPARAALEAAHGYDTKHGAHLVRLLRMGREILETGEVRVWRGGHDAEELQAIRQGAWSYEALVDWAEREARGLRELVETGEIAVPEQPDHTVLDELIADLTEAHLRGQRVDTGRASGSSAPDAQSPREETS